MAKPKTARTNVAAMRLGAIRQLHVWISVFIAPSLLFFAITGALQTFRIPDQKTAPLVIQKLARLHKDDVFAMKPPRPKQADGHEAGGEGGRRHEGGDHDGAGAGQKGADKGAVAKAGPERAEGKLPEKPSVTAMKWFSAAVAVGIAITTLFGLWLALVYSRNKLLIWALLIAGAATPAIIAAL